jgi:quercetin dioxygenase-like cupin family protein
MSDHTPTIIDLRAPVETPADGIVSRAIHSDDDVRVVLFSFAAGQELSDHTAPMPITLEIVAGDAVVTVDGQVTDAPAGTWLHLPASTPHSVEATSPVTMLLTLLKSAS